MGHLSIFAAFRFLAALFLVGCVVGCGDTQNSSASTDNLPVETETSVLSNSSAIGSDSDGSSDVSSELAEPLTTAATLDLLTDSWDVYKDRFIQDDGRVIDWEAQDRTVSEGQAYAMLRAVMMDDPATFESTLTWAEVNLERRDASGVKLDHLWAWQWGQKVGTAWGILDETFASDADLDAATALILAAQRWDRPDYLELARTKLADLWTLSTVEIPIAVTEQGSDRYFLPGPRAAFQQGLVTYLNPSYFAPYAFRLFAEVDPDHDWLALIDTSYAALNQSASISTMGLPSDWVGLDIATGDYRAVDPLLPLKSVYSFDAFRVWWRVALDYLLFESPEAKDFLVAFLPELENQWRSHQFIAAVIDSNGQDIVDYESTAQYAMLHTAFRIVEPAIADDIWSQKLFPAYKNGIWDNDTAYYTQNLAWFGLASTAELVPLWFSEGSEEIGDRSSESTQTE
ncbi:MAG: glycosyl hydrolase [Merismopedia sp. SIO2A8]|nr:glycosyl hydrolase [Merismopedia sp. SIO2A8]